MTEFARFGDPSRFEIAVRWTRDSEPRARRPASHGWSTGDLKITIGDKAITHSRRGAAQQSHVGWYLAPLFDWLASNWGSLLHEEAFAWTEKHAVPAVIACHHALDRWIATTDAYGRERYKAVQSWYRRHALRQASEGGLFPDLFLRRFGDEIELSWSATSPLFAPNDFVFVVEPGIARLKVAEVAEPLWEALQWCASEPPTHLPEHDRQTWRALCQKIELHSWFDERRARQDPMLTSGFFARSDRRWSVRGVPNLLEEDVGPGHPFVETFSPAVAMFGGVNPNLTQPISTLFAACSRGPSGEAIARRSRASWKSTQRAQSAFLMLRDTALPRSFSDEIKLPGAETWIDIRNVVHGLQVEIKERELRTDSIRGVALAGAGFRPTIVVNSKSIFNVNEYGKRFTIAHELCHILFDRARARRVDAYQWSWAAPGIERRANAFAAYLLMPRVLLLRIVGDPHYADEPAVVRSFANALQVNETALIQHLYNLGLDRRCNSRGLACAIQADIDSRAMNAQSLVAKVWNFAHVLRDQGVSYQAYISQISYLLFLKMDEERVTQIGEASHAARRRALGRHQGPRGRGAESTMSSCWRSCPAVRHDRRDLPEGAERNSGPRQAQAARRADR